MNPMLLDLGGVADQTSIALVGVPAQDPPPPPGRGAEFGKASPVALVVILLMALATAVLIRSMTVRIKRLPRSFDEPDSPSDDGATGPAVPPGDRDAEDAGGPRG